MNHKVAKVEALENLNLKVTFKCETVKIYDVKQLFKEWEPYNRLKDYNLFKKVRRNRYGHYIYWNNILDIPSEWLWEDGKTIGE